MASLFQLHAVACLPKVCSLPLGSSVDSPALVVPKVLKTPPGAAPASPQGLSTPKAVPVPFPYLLHLPGPLESKGTKVCLFHVFLSALPSFPWRDKGSNSPFPAF